MTKIFISHNTQDKTVADILVDFLIAVGIPRDEIFYSSLPGNNVKENITSEIREGLDSSNVYFCILSSSYYQSAYCLNEAGIIWYKQAATIIIGLPEISIDSMQAFLNKDYMIRHLNNSEDIYAIIDFITKTLGLPYISHQVVNTATKKVVQNYNDFINERKIIFDVNKLSKNIDLEIATTDDEKIVLYYMIEKGIRKTTSKDIRAWLQKKEMFNININNGFDLLSSLGNSKYENDTFELDITYFKKFTTQKDEYLSALRPIVLNHYKLVSNTFISLWQRNIFPDDFKLFLSYLIENKISKLGDRWKANFEIDSLKIWVNENSFPLSVANKYGEYLNILINNNLVYESEWTSYGNPREYTIYDSLQTMLFNKNFPFCSELQELKKKTEIQF